ncbi:hypothetical protein ABZX75_11270 [Streptomyces sp. NPDC003038]|uniref:hypothetical protein n=1 Tax=unclassified Streptomyces TaxID=2593676 RepID=UPI0033AE9ABA
MMDDHTPPGGTSEEQVLRGLLRGAVEGLEPSEGALERLRYAVPVRRTLKRQAFVGAAAVALLAGTAIPAALHLTGGEGTTTDHSAIAGHGAHPGGKGGGVGSSDPHQNGSGTPPQSTRPTGSTPDAGGTTGEQPAPAASGSPDGGVTAGPSGAASAGSVAGSGPLPPVAAPGAPGCGAEQLGVVGSARAPQPDGKVLGTFKVTNVSARGCTVTGPDTVTAVTATGTAPSQGPGVTVVGHTAGDPASGLLPDPSAETPQLTLQPNTAYEVRFAWVPPAEPCPAASTGPSPEPTRGGTPDASARTAADTEGTARTEPGTGGATPDPAGVAVSHTPSTGAPTTQATIPAACGGTVYRTGVIPLDAPEP